MFHTHVCLIIHGMQVIRFRIQKFIFLPETYCRRYIEYLVSQDALRSQTHFIYCLSEMGVTTTKPTYLPIMCIQWSVPEKKRTAATLNQSISMPFKLRSRSFALSLLCYLTLGQGHKNLYCDLQLQVKVD